MTDTDLIEIRQTDKRRVVVSGDYKKRGNHWYCTVTRAELLTMAMFRSEVVDVVETERLRGYKSLNGDDGI